MTIKVYKVKRFQQNSDTVQADIQNAQFEQGSRANLRQNAFIGYGMFQLPLPGLLL